jgi:hypothetical protein
MFLADQVRLSLGMPIKPIWTAAQFMIGILNI